MGPDSSAGRNLLSVSERLGEKTNESHLRETLEEQNREINQLVASLLERQQLLERLSKIQSSISHRKPLQEVLDAITLGARELLGDEVVGLRLQDPKDPSWALVVSSQGLSPELADAIRRAPMEEGAGGKAMLEDRLVVIDDYATNTGGIAALRERSLQAAMAAPVHENGRAIGSLVVATYNEGRTYTESEKEALLALAEHCSLAITDAKTVEAMRDAERAKDMFLAMVSHELKTPLTVVMGTLKTLERHHDSLSSEARAEMLTAAIDRCGELHRLIDRLLQGASAELADAESDTFLPQLVEDALRGFEHASRLNIGEIPELSLSAYAASVHRILGILVENALAHSTTASPICVGADLEERDVILWVENDGEIPFEDPDELFQPFQRGPDATSSGVGLGLYIARRIAVGMSGHLTAHMEEDKVRFCLRFPLRKRGLPAMRPDPSLI